MSTGFDPTLPSGFTRAYLHRPEELRREVSSAGLWTLDLVGLEGVGFAFGDYVRRWADLAKRAALVEAARLIEGSHDHRASCTGGARSEGRRRMSRIDGVDLERIEKRIGAVLEAQAQKWGGPLLNHLLYARRPTIFRGVRAMWGGLDASGLLDPALVTLINRRVASLNGCVF